MSATRARKRASSSQLTIPAHVAIIMDGNGRWATARGKRRTAGHKAGIDSVQAVLEAARDLGIRELTLYAFSTENWKRPKSEVSFLMRTLRSYLVEHRRKMVKDGVRLNVFGDVEPLSAAVKAELAKTVKATVRGRRLQANLALNYGSHEEIARAARLAAGEVAAGRMSPDEVTPEVIENFLYTAGHLPPDLIVRTAGEERLSNFMLWQACYAELYFTPVLWPDFRRLHLEEAIESYSRRQRRFGGLAPES
jgi:undecaprenyl diphosphate synthase